MSNPRIIQNNGQRLYLRLYNPGGGGSGINQLTGDVLAGPGTGSQAAALKVVNGNVGSFGDGTHVPQFTVDAKGRILAVANVGIPGLTPTSMPKASDLGILDNGTDQTTALNTAFANANYAGIIMDFSAPGAVTISGTVNVQGKLILFYPGSYFTGAGTLNNGYHTAGYWQKCFDITVSLTNWKTMTVSFSSAWFGADATGATDAQPALQKTTDTMIANAAAGMTRTLKFLPGTYKTNTTWMWYNWTGTTYGQWTLNVEGEWRAAYSNLQGFPNIVPTFKDGPAIGIQRTLATRVLGIAIQGLFTSSLSYDTFVQTTFATANVAAVRDTQWSPYGGIVVDPVTNNAATIPPDGGYPQLNGSLGGTNYYRGDGSRGGSTAVVISNCKIAGFTTDIIFSPNGDTQQGEDCVVEECFLDFAKVAVAFCQTQSDNCMIRNCRSWDNVWTVLDGISYGYGVGLVANIDQYNVAGTVNTLFNVFTNKQFSIDKFYAESFFQIGRLGSQYAGSTLNGNFNFGVSDFTPQYHAQLTNIKVTGGSWRYYDDAFNKRIRLSPPNNVVFEDVMFDLPPYIVGQQDDQFITCRYVNCPLPGISAILGMCNDMYFVNSANLYLIPYGKFKIQDGIGLNDGLSPTYTLDYDNTTFNRFINGFTGSITITPDSNRQCVITVSATNAALCLVNDIVYNDATRAVIGRISAISGTSITISEIPVNIVTGSYTLDLVYFITTQGNCIGDVTSGQPTVSNVSPLFATKPPIANTRYDSPLFPQGTYVVSYNSSTKVITMSANASKTAVRQNLINGSPKIEVRSPYAPSATFVNSYAKALPTGATWIEVVSVVGSSVFRDTIWTFSKGGYLSATTLGFGSGFQSEFNINPPIRFDGTNYQAYNTYTDTWTTL